jgi:hypothetical protein
MGGSSLSVSVLRLPDGDVVVYDETSHGVWLTRKKAPRKRRVFDPAAHSRRVDADVRVLEEKVWIPAMTRFFVEQGAVLARRMESRSRRLAKYEVRRAPLDIDQVREDATKRATDMLKDFFDEDAFKEALIDTAGALYDDVVDVALASTSVTMNVDFNVAARDSVKELIRERANQLAGHVSDSTYDQVTRVLRDGIIEGKSIPALADLVQTELQGASRTRAETIARTEVVSAYNGGVYEGGTSLPADVAAGMVWLAALDERTRPSHAEADGQSVVMGEPFVVDGEELRYPGDPEGSPENTINCRCATAILTPEDMESRMLHMRDVSDVLVRMAVHGLTYLQALREMRVGDVVGHAFHGNLLTEVVAGELSYDAALKVLRDAAAESL